MPAKDNFPVVFERLKAILQEQEPLFALATNKPDSYYLNGPPTSLYPQYPDGFPFGGVQVKKNYVSYHLFPIYMFPDLAENLSERLKKRKQGKSCFNFSKLDEDLMNELAQLTTICVERMRKQELL